MDPLLEDPINTNKSADLIITELSEKYKENPYILNRLQIYITNLPTMLDLENKKYEERVSRINELTLEQDNFYKVFLSKHQYFYMPYNNIYYEYDGKTFRIIKDDDIHHHLLSTITDEGKLMPWKHKTKQNIIKQIKDRTLFKSVPETYTIQNVLGFLQTIFETKMDAKYFLTIIGDCILKKNVSEKPLQYFINSNTKKLVLLIDSIGYITTGTSIMGNFISKYHDTHDLLCYRLIKTNDSPISSELIKDQLNKIGIDLLCVAAHYSDRYSNSDNFLNIKAEETNKMYSMIFLHNSVDKIVTDFIKQCIDVSTNTLSADIIKYSLSWKNMHYIWKQYLSSINVPNMIYTSGLKDLLKSKLLYSNNSNNNSNNSNSNNSNSNNSNNELQQGLGQGSDLNNNDIVFLNVTSKFLPSVSSFMSFWEKHITILTNNNNNNIDNIDNIDSFDDEYEIDEIASLYKSSEFKNVLISDKDIIKMINHYFSPQVEVIDNKYVTNIRCNLWTKHEDISAHLDIFKAARKISLEKEKEEKELISFDELYKSYKSYCQAKHIVDKHVLPIVSKQFFEKYLLHELHNYIKFDRFVSSEWIHDE